MSQVLFPSSVALKFHQGLALMMGKSDHCAKPSPAHFKDSQWSYGLDTVVANPCAKMMSRAGHSVYSGSHLTSFFGHIMLLNLDLTNCSNPRS